jgi:hypothetical protein
MALTKITKTGIGADAIDGTKLADNAISEEHLDTTVFTGNTELSASAASDDILLIYDTSAGVIKKIQKSNVSLQVPTFSSVSPTSLETGDLTGNYTIVVTGTGFDENATFKLRTTGGTDISMDSVTRNSSTQLTGTVAKNTANLTSANEPFDIIITNGSGLAVVAADQINVDAQPVYTTASGSLGSGTGGDSLSFSVNATDPESAGNVTFELQSGSLPPGLSLTNTAAEGGTAIISGTATNPGANTTYNFTLRAVDAASNTSSRAFSITINRAVTSESFTSTGTFSVPSGTTAVDVLVVAGGGAAGPEHGGGGGAGGLIFFPEYPVTPGGTVSVTVGCGGVSAGSTGPASPPAPGWDGQDSVFGTLTAKGGGGAGNYAPGATAPITDGRSGGSGGGGGTPGQPGPGGQGGSATQPTQPGNSGAYGFGNAGGSKVGFSTPYASAGGGGAGAAGSAPLCGVAGDGGDGKAYTIADGTTPVYYAGGGGAGAYGPGGTHPGTAGAVGGQGGGGPGNTLLSDQPGVGQSGVNGTANRGGGAGSPSRWEETQPGSGRPQAGGTIGGKGIVIVRY